MKRFSKIIQDRLSALGDEKKARWLESYVKHNIQSKGVGIPQIRTVIKEENRNNSLTQMASEKQLELIDDLMRQPFTEDKLAAILYLQLYWKEKEPSLLLSLIADWFDQKWIGDWNVCDWLCVRILTPMVERATIDTVPTLEAWNEADYLWKARASLVPFAQVKNITSHYETIRRLSAQLIRREERFCKTSVGWVLREYSRHDPDFVIKFLEEYEPWTTREVVKNATKYLER